MRRIVSRTIVPNHDPSVTLLRIWPDSVERLPIIGWDIQIDQYPNPDAPDYPDEGVTVIPITLEDATHGVCNCVLLSDGHVYQPDQQSWESEWDAIRDCQLILRPKSAK